MHILLNALCEAVGILLSRCCYKHLQFERRYYFSMISSKHVWAIDDDDNTVKPVCNDHLNNKIYYFWFIR